MNFRLKCEKPEEIEYTIVITMKAGEWELVRESLDTAQKRNHPAHQVIGAINDLLAQARKIYWPKDDEVKP